MELVQELINLKVGRVIPNVSLKEYTTYRIGGTARVLVFIDSIDSLKKLLQFLRKNQIKHKILGNGSNLIFKDGLYNGVLIRLTDLNHMEIRGTEIEVEAGYSLQKLALKAAKASLTGLEFAAGIPGTVGGAIFMNAGAYKSDMGYIVRCVTMLDENLEVKTITNKECNFHYRTSYFKEHPNCVCLSAILTLNKGMSQAILAVMEDRKTRRVLSQPLEYPSAGSVFRNPEGDYAGRLIESLGYKGKLFGGAMVSEKHANFIINKENAKASDVITLIYDIQKNVKKTYGIDLKLEQEIVE
ncbi:MAG: UDP-N-acetylmuramate dehydrogenase [Firmicutes bacterium]|nr:UDP-N-acetylmuramate dehydrogenase [Bacillota bacterium]